VTIRSVHRNVGWFFDAIAEVGYEKICDNCCYLYVMFCFRLL